MAQQQGVAVSLDANDYGVLRALAAGRRTRVNSQYVMSVAVKNSVGQYPPKQLLFPVGD